MLSKLVDSLLALKPSTLIALLHALLPHVAMLTVVYALYVLGGK
jgi:hypothetical protein